MAYDPIIIIGMHRSGTSLLVRILERIGVFFGAHQDSNKEAWFFLDLNNWLLRSANAAWDNPYNFRFINDYFRQQTLRVLEQHLRTFFTRRKFLGWHMALRYRTIKDLDFPWGWKDPRNTFTIDIWKHIFPGARLLHIYRNPIDVAQSLHLREVKARQEGHLHKGFKNRVKEFTTSGTVNYQFSLRVDDIHEGIKLWEEYTAKAFSLEHEFRGRLLHIKFEDLLGNPTSTLKTVADFLQLNSNNKVANSMHYDLDINRMYAFLRNRELVLLHEQYKKCDLITRLGYHELPGATR